MGTSQVHLFLTFYLSQKQMSTTSVYTFLQSILIQQDSKLSFWLFRFMMNKSKHIQKIYFIINTNLNALYMWSHFEMKTIIILVRQMRKLKRRGLAMSPKVTQLGRGEANVWTWPICGHSPLSSIAGPRVAQENIGQPVHM